MSCTPQVVSILHGLAGLLFSTLFGGHGQQQRGPSADTSPPDFSEGRQGHAPPGTDEQQLAGAAGQQLTSGGREEGTALEEDKAGHSQHESQEQRMQQRPSQPPTAEQVVASDGQATDEEPVEADASIAEAEAELARAGWTIQRHSSGKVLPSQEQDVCCGKVRGDREADDSVLDTGAVVSHEKVPHEEEAEEIHGKEASVAMHLRHFHV